MLYWKASFFSSKKGFPLIYLLNCSHFNQCVVYLNAVLTFRVYRMNFPKKESNTKVPNQTNNSFNKPHGRYLKLDLKPLSTTSNHFKEEHPLCVSHKGDGMER